MNANFKEAVRGWRLVRKGRTGEEVAAIVLAQKAKKEEKKSMKKKNREDLSTLIDRLDDRAWKACMDSRISTWQIWFEMSWPTRPEKDDAMRHISYEATERFNAPRFDEDTKTLMESNQDSLGMWS